MGNAEDDGVDYRGWLVGGFVKADNARATGDVEIKWGLHPAGDTRAGWNPDENATTLCLLVSGRFNLEFDTELVTLARPSDYAVWGPGVKHLLDALDGSVSSPPAGPHLLREGLSRRLPGIAPPLSD